MSKTTIRVTARTAGYARVFDVLEGLYSQCKHKGGKLVICVVNSSDVRRAEDMLNASYMVEGYAVCL